MRNPTLGIGIAITQATNGGTVRLARAHSQPQTERKINTKHPCLHCCRYSPLSTAPHLLLLLLLLLLVLRASNPAHQPAHGFELTYVPARFKGRGKEKVVRAGRERRGGRFVRGREVLVRQKRLFGSLLFIKINRLSRPTMRSKA